MGSCSPPKNALRLQSSPYPSRQSDPFESRHPRQRPSSSFGGSRPLPSAPLPRIVTTEELQRQDHYYNDGGSLLGRASEEWANKQREKKRREAEEQMERTRKEADALTGRTIYSATQERKEAAYFAAMKMDGVEATSNTSQNYPQTQSSFPAYATPPYTPSPPYDRLSARPSFPFRQPSSQTHHSTGSTAPTPPSQSYPHSSRPLARVTSYSNPAYASSTTSRFSPSVERLPSMSTLGLLGDSRNGYLPSGFSYTDPAGRSYGEIGYGGSPQTPSRGGRGGHGGAPRRGTESRSFGVAREGRQ